MFKYLIVGILSEWIVKRVREIKIDGIILWKDSVYEFNCVRFD